jgi:hypothetical protein
VCERRVQVERTFVLSCSRRKLSTKACKVCAGWAKSRGCDSEQRESRLLLRVSAQSQRTSTLSVFEDSPQGCVQGVLPEGFEVTKLRRDKTLNSSKDCTKRLCWKYSSKCWKLACSWTGFVE